MHNNNERSHTILSITVKIQMHSELARAILHNFDKSLFILCLQDWYFN